MFPALENLSYANPVVGFGFYSTGYHTEGFILSKDGSSSDHGTRTQLKEFNVSHFDQSQNPIKTIKVNYFGLIEGKHDPKNTGLLLGVELFDFKDEVINRAGLCSKASFVA